MKFQRIEFSWRAAFIGLYIAPGETSGGRIALPEPGRSSVLQAQGFLGYTAYVDRDCGRFVGISLWETRQDLEASAGTALEARNAAADLGAETIGEPHILEMAFDARPPVSLPATHASTNTLLPQR